MYSIVFPENYSLCYDCLCDIYLFFLITKATSKGNSQIFVTKENSNLLYPLK